MPSGIFYHHHKVDQISHTTALASFLDSFFFIPFWGENWKCVPLVLSNGSVETDSQLPVTWTMIIWLRDLTCTVSASQILQLLSFCFSNVLTASQIFLIMVNYGPFWNTICICIWGIILIGTCVHVRYQNEKQLGQIFGFTTHTSNILLKNWEVWKKVLDMLVMDFVYTAFQTHIVNTWPAS